MTVAEFLAWDDGTDTRHELIHGVPVAMAPPSDAHGTVVANLVRSIGNALPPQCRAVSQAGIARDDARDTFLVADVAVSCVAAEPGRSGTPDPLVLVEVLSPSTADHDRGTKLDVYFGIGSVRDILFVHAQERRALLYSRQADAWVLQHFIGDAVIRLTGLDLELPMAEVYRNAGL
jgi:Uma2 family endonuclease